MDEYYYDAIDLLKELIATPSVSRNEKDAADVLQRHIIKFGFTPKRHNNNIWILDTDFRPERETILLNAHIDTVKAAASWQRDPFTPTEEGDRIYGLGSNDDGGSLVSLLTAFRIMMNSSRAHNLIFLASAEEEVGGVNGITSVLPMLPPISFALVGEPTGMQPALAEKGLMVLDGEVKGVSGHAARNEGVNAIYKAIEVIETLRTFKFPNESELLGPVKISVTKIEAGTAHNVVPDLCKFLVDVRTTDAYSNVETLEILQRLVEGKATLTAHSTRLNPSSISREHPFVKRILMLGKTPYGSPTLSDQSLIPYPSLKMGPGESSRSHTADEYITTDEIRDAIQTYVSLLLGF